MLKVIRSRGRRRRRLWGSAAAIGLLAVLVSSAVGSSAATAATKKSRHHHAKGAPLVIGAAVSLSGYSAVSDTGILQGIKLAAAELNRHGGVAGHKVVIKVADVQSSAATAVTVANQLINGDHADVLVGGLVSTATAAMGPIAKAHNVPLMVGSALPSGDLSWTFSQAPPISHLVGLQLLFARKKLHVKKVGILYSNTVYGQSYTAYAKKRAPKLHLNVVGAEAMDPTATDLTSQVSSLLDAGAQAIIDETFGGQQLVITQDLVSLNASVPLVLNAESPPTAKSATSIYPKTYFIVLPVTVAVKKLLTKAQRKTSSKYVRAFTSKYGSQSDVQDGCRGWDMMRIVAKAVRKSHAVTGTALRNALERVRYQGCSTRYAYAKNDHYGQEKVGITTLIAHFKNGFASAVYAPAVKKKKK